MIKRFSHEQMLKQTGGWYLIILLATAQLIALFGAIPGIISVRINSGLHEQPVRGFAFLTILLILVGMLLVLYISWQMTPRSRKILDVWADDTIRLKPEDEFIAWREITGLTWRYGVTAMTVGTVLVILLFLRVANARGITAVSAFQPSSLQAADPAYVLIGGIVALLGMALLAILMIERFIMPLRLLLLPKDFEWQLQARSGLLLNRKFLIITMALIAIGVLLIAPLGFQQIITVLFTETDVTSIFQRLQLQSILFSIFALILGAGFSYYVAKEVSDPINDLIETFNKIEQGDLRQRVPVHATDELGIVTVQFNRMLARLETLQSNLEQQVVERTKQLAATNEVGRVAVTSLDPEQLLARIIPLFQEQFGYYYAAIYLLDPSGRWAELKEATGEAGKVLKQNHHRLEVAGKSMVGASIRDRAPRIAQLTTEEKQRYENPLLPYTRSEITLPLMVGERVLGALNVQSTKEADFGPQVIETMRNMAGQLAIALENARLYQEAQQIITEMRSVQRQYLFEGWSGFSDDNKKLEYRIGDEDEMDENSRKLEVDISLRDQSLGHIMLEGKHEWTAEQQSLVDAIATQAAIALENARLVSESRQIAVRERMAAEISSKIWSSATIDGVLQTVVKELGRRLDASSATIELHLDDTNTGDEA